MKQTNDKIIKWLRDNKIDTLDLKKQYLKIIEEVGELARGLLKDDKELIKDAIGDIYVAVKGLSLQLKVSAYGTAVYQGWNDYEILKEILFILHKDFEELEHLSLIGLLSILAINHNLTLKECVNHAYNEIKNRDIKIIKGVAVK